jgi:hypothetical protein
MKDELGEESKLDSSFILPPSFRFFPFAILASGA